MFIISLGILTKQSSSTITLELYVSIKTIPQLHVKAPNNLAVIYVEYLCSLNFKVQDYRAKKGKKLHCTNIVAHVGKPKQRSYKFHNMPHYYLIRWVCAVENKSTSFTNCSRLFHHLFPLYSPVMFFLHSVSIKLCMYIFLNLSFYCVTGYHC